jgi:hypothetical protein
MTMASYRCGTTGLEHQPSTQPRPDGPGRSAHDYGTEGREFSPSERAQVTGPYPLLEGVFSVPVGPMLGATAADPGPRST